MLASAAGSQPASSPPLGSGALGPAAGTGGPAGAAAGLPHDIRGSLTIPFSWWEKILLVLLALLLLAAFIAAWRWWQRWRARRPQAPADPWDLLQGRLGRLTPVQPFTKTAQEDFYFQLSLLLREAIELRTGLQATDRTYQELRALLGNALPLPKDQAEAVLKMLERADLIKFSPAPSDDAEALALAAQVGDWLAQLRPPPRQAKEDGHAPR